MTTRFRRKVTEAEGIVWDGNAKTLDDIAVMGASIMPSATSHTDIVLYVAKSNARVTVHLGDVVMREPDGEGFYPVAAAILRATYVTVDDDLVDEAKPTFMVPDQLTPMLATITLRRVGWRAWDPDTEQYVVVTDMPVDANCPSLYVIEGLS